MKLESGQPRPKRSWSARIAAFGGAAFLFLAAQLRAGGPGGGFAAGGGGGGGGDAVGSLPATHGGAPDAGAFGTPGALGETFALKILCEARQIDALVVQAVGDGRVHVRDLDGRGTLELTFQGEVHLTLDRRVLGQGFLAAALEIGPAFSGGVVKASAGERTSLQPLAAGELALPLQQLAWVGLIDVGVDVIATTPARKASRLALRANGEVVQIHLAP
jgi:hypothetical protein